MNALFFRAIEAVKTVKKHFVWLLAFAGLIVVAVVLGVVSSKPAAVRSYYETYCREYVQSVYISSLFKLFFTRLIACAFFFLLVCPLFFTVFYLPAALLVLFFKGYVFGVTTSVLLSTYSVNGFFLWLLCSLPAAAYAFFISVSACIVALAEKKCKRKSHISDILPYFILLGVCVLAGVIAEILLVFVVFRPVSKIF